MRMALVGADCEENLGLGMIAASLLGAGHAVEVFAFDDRAAVERAAEAVLASRPDAVGLALQFQFRAPDFLALARRLRALGYRGHITLGGQHATHAWEPLLAGEPAVDSVVLHEGERTVVELAAALAQGSALTAVAGLALRGPTGPVRTPARPLDDELDALPEPHRYRAHTEHLGHPFIPVSGSRGCWGSCAFCSITSFYRGARAAAGGRLLRLRSPVSLADEMARLHHAAGGRPCLFCFHDDTLLLPRAADSLARLAELRHELHARGVTQYGLIGKCRPDTITPEVARELRELGVIRMFVGIENASAAGLLHLGRQTTRPVLERALGAFHEAGIFAAYNLLLFEPDTTLDDVRENAAFLRRHGSAAGSFCRAEPYHGTPLHRRLAERGALLGDHRGWDYRIADDRVELLFRLVLAAFRERNYDPLGVSNRYVGLGYMAQIVRVFHDAESSRARRVLTACDELMGRVAADSAELLEAAIDRVAGLALDDAGAAEQAAVELALRVGERDRALLGAIDQLMDELVVLSRTAPQAPQRSRARARGGVPGARGREVVQQLALAGALMASVPACGGTTTSRDPETTGGAGTGGMVAGDGGFPPTVGGTGGAGGTGGYVQGDGGFPPVIGGTGGTTGGAGGTGGYVQGDGGFPPVIGGTGGTTGGAGGTGGYTPGDGGFPPVVGGTGGTGGTLDGDGGFPPAIGGASGGEGGVPSALGGAGGELAVGAGAPGYAGTAQLAPLGQWRDTSPARPTRSAALPLHDPPAVVLAAVRDGASIRVSVAELEAGSQVHWSGPGHHEPCGAELLWTPTSPGDRLTVVVRRPGGVAATTLLAADVVAG